MWPTRGQEMCATSAARVSELLVNWGRGDQDAREALIPLVYGELRRLARHYLRGERPDHTLQSAALVNEAYLRLVRQELPQWQNRAHFLRFFARMMRQTLINHAVARTRKKRGGEDYIWMTLEFYERQKIDVTVVDAALQDLEKFDPRQAQVVELRFFGGLTIAEIASAIGISTTTVKREWAIAKLWLRRRLSKR